MSYYYLQTSNDHLAHHGKLGMRWGIRRYQPYEKGSKGGKEVGEAAKNKVKQKEGPSKIQAATQKEQRKLVKQDEKYVKTVLREGAIPIYERTNEAFSKKLDDINKKYGENARGDEYTKELVNTWEKTYRQSVKDLYEKKPIQDGNKWLENSPDYNEMRNLAASEPYGRFRGKITRLTYTAETPKIPKTTFDDELKELDADEWDALEKALGPIMSSPLRFARS